MMTQLKQYQYILCHVILISLVLSKRQDITKLSPETLNKYRDSVQSLQDSGQWINLAGDHGIPNQFCPHGNLKFLIWHRRQIARIEQMLGMPLPYWDWTKTNGIPEPCQSSTYQDSDGNNRPNPLYTGPKIGGGSTTRQPLPDFDLQSLQNQEQMAMASTKFEDFSQYLEGAHNDIHGDVGGDMNALDYAAFDPIFWMHHNNVDRIWYRWQRRNKFAMYPAESRGELQDSLGIFMGEDVINDLSGWIQNGKQPNVSSTELPTMSSTGSISGTGLNTSTPPPSTPSPSTQFQTLSDDDDQHHEHNHDANHNLNNRNLTIDKAPAYLSSLKSVRHELHELQSPLQIQTDQADDPELRTSVEQPGYQVRNRNVLQMKGIEAGSDPLRIDMYLAGELIGWIQTFGMGHSNMTYKLDRFFDITKHQQKCSHDKIQEQIQFRVTNQRTGQIDIDKTYELALVSMVF